MDGKEFSLLLGILFMLFAICISQGLHLHESAIINQQIKQLKQQNEQILKQTAYLGKKTILCWNDETEKIETLAGETWEVWELTVDKFKRIDKIYNKDRKEEK